MAGGSTERLILRTRARLFAMTLALLTLLVVGVGTATAIIGLSALDADVDRALAASVQAQAQVLGNELPTGEEDRDGGEGSEHGPSVGADTVLLVLRTDGSVLLNPSGRLLPGLPATAALDAANDGGDMRTIASSSMPVRVYTVPLVEDGRVAAYVQGGFDLSLHETQSHSLVLAIVAVSILSLLAAALITLLVTGRALVPVREGFEAQRRFVADASHELRTPAALIRANAEVLEREGLVAEDGRDLLADVIAEADRLGGLVGDLLQLAAWEETRLALSRSAVDAAEVARDTVRGARALAAERLVSLVVDADAAAPVSADRARLVQLLLVLVDNAVEHSPAGGVVTVRVRREGGAGPGEVVLEVDDQGRGIPPTDRQKIFEPFTRLPGATRHRSGGTGLGLAIARRIAEAHGGSIAAGAPPAGGARFTVRLPGSPA